MVHLVLAQALKGFRLKFLPFFSLSLVPAVLYLVSTVIRRDGHWLLADFFGDIGYVIALVLIGIFIQKGCSSAERQATSTPAKAMSLFVPLVYSNFWLGLILFVPLFLLMVLSALIIRPLGGLEGIANSPSLLAGLIVVLTIVSGVWLHFFVLFSLTYPSVVLGEKRGYSALLRSRQLASPRENYTELWKVWIVLGLLWILRLVPQLPTILVHPVPNLLTTIGDIASALLFALVFPITVLTMTVSYEDFNRRSQV